MSASLSARVKRLERGGASPDDCPACADRRGRVVVVVQNDPWPDGKVSRPEPCPVCGTVPETVLEVSYVSDFYTRPGASAS